MDGKLLQPTIGEGNVKQQLEKMVQHIEAIKNEVDHIEDEDLEMLRYRLKLLDLLIMRVRERRQRGKS
jgi:ABC-type phosphate transport system auxiliary subunit